MVVSGISSIFGEGASETTWENRNQGQHLVVEEILKNKNRNRNSQVGGVLLLGGGFVESIEVSKRFPDEKIILMDRSEKARKYIKQVQEKSDTIINIAEEFKNPIVGAAVLPGSIKAERVLNCSEGGFTGELIEGDITETLFNINEGSQGVIMAHNVLNNIRFQKSTNYADFFSEVVSKLSEDGIFSFVDNYEWFNTNINNQVSTIDLLEMNNLEMLYNYPYYGDMIKNDDGSVITENNNMMLQKQGGGNHITFDINGIKKYFSDLLDHKNIEYEILTGSYIDYKKSLTGNNTNLVMIKVGEEGYFWINIGGNYLESFENLLKGGALELKHISEFIIDK